MQSRLGSRGFWIAVSALILFMLYWGAMSLLGLKQRQDQKAVREYITKVQPILAADARFKYVKLLGYSCDNVLYPYMPVSGKVRSKNDWGTLNYLIQTSKSPVSISLGTVRVALDRTPSKTP
jgi:hypothetical protein